MSEKFKLETNIPLTCVFKYDNPKVWENTGTNGPYKSYSYAITAGKVEGFLSLYDREHEILQKHAPLKGKTLVLLKHEVGGNKKEFTVSTQSEVSLQKGMEMAQENMSGTMDELAHPQESTKTGKSEIEVMDMIIERLNKHQHHFGQNFSAVVNTVFMQVYK